MSASKLEGNKCKYHVQSLVHLPLATGCALTQNPCPIVTMDQDPDKSWSGTESEPISEGNAVEHMAFPSSGTSTQLPVTPKPISFSNLPQMTSTPLISSQKVISPVNLCLVFV